MLFYTFLAYLEGPQNKKNSKFIEGRSKKYGTTKYRVVGVRIVQERFLNSSLGVCVLFLLFYTFLAYLEGPEHKKNSKFIEGRRKKAAQQNTGL